MSSTRIDQQTQDLAKELASANGHGPDYAWEIGDGGGFVPAWAMYVSEATKLIKLTRIIATIKKEK